MSKLEVVIGFPESHETNCFGDGTGNEWERSYSVTGHELSLDEPVSGMLRYAPDEYDDSARIDVDGFRPPDTHFTSRKEAYLVFKDDDMAAQLILQTLADVIELKKSLRAVAEQRSLRRSMLENN